MEFLSYDLRRCYCPSSHGIDQWLRDGIKTNDGKTVN